MSSKEIGKFLEQLCSTTFEGGRIVASNTTVIIYDVPYWPGERTDALRQRFPHCDVDIQQAPTTSASGFVVVVSIKEPVGYVRVCIAISVAAVLSILTGMAAMSVFLSEHPDWGEDYFYNGFNESCVNDTLN
jgi:hypothetical protein